MEPKYIGIYQFPTDLIQELIASRKQLLQEKYPSLTTDYECIQSSLKKHKQQLNRKSMLVEPKQIDKLMT